MNPIDFEKTRIFADKAKEASIPAAPVVPSIPQVQSPAAKPSIKKLTKEEKLLLAAGGVLSVGLGAIVIANVIEEDTEPFTESEKPVIEAPVIEVDASVEPADAAKPLVSRPAPPVNVPSPAKTDDRSHGLITIPEHPQVAEAVTDDMSFEEAFKVARNEVGPGGLFVWNDTYYGTFRESEWEGLSEAKKDQWITAVEPIIDPQIPEPGPDPIAGDEHVVIADRGEIIWTGIDKNGDGVAEILTARVQGQPPIVMMDTDNDGRLDTRYFLDAASGQMASSSMEQTVMGMNDINEIPQIEPGSTFYTAGYRDSGGGGDLPVSIIEENGSYIVGIDTDGDALVDILALNQDGKEPFVAMDMDSDGRVETSYTFHSEQQIVVSLENQPMEPMLLTDQEELPDPTYTAEVDDDVLDDDDLTHAHPQREMPPAYAAHLPSVSEHHASAGDPDDMYFNNHSDAADDFVG
ncbi:hypothetical protein [Runella slithyformis]|uniref:Uncharacterized protein n=1 Tax=Runella slithyformis (strain ATCC 29530 / DSM 19594 / LMG 11500 / NCIMB 11436 / LSU 4) TaxID=761193 RepID=A0A7U4E8M6_RUNSL|nr:hypothetical protein [Runella slithyformis]AEI51508.1 hypothetical protein Runsl_5208 [Runella slithyformis DSM 19594]